MESDSSTRRMTEIGSVANKRTQTANDIIQEDRISNLPSGPISDILSRLSTKDAVRTSALSRNWKDKWTTIYDIEMDERVGSFSVESATASFTDVVTEILLRTHNTKTMRFRLFCDSAYHFGHLEKWMSDILMRKVENVVITATKIKGLDSPYCFSGWTSLTELMLEMSCTLKVPANNRFPNLVVLGLFGGEHGHIKIMTTKVPGTSRAVLIFPVLAILQLIDCEWVDVNSVEIQAPELLQFSSSGGSRQLKSFEIKICGPKLAVFELDGNGPVNNHILSAPQAVTYAALSNMLRDETSALNAYKIWTKFSNLKCLRIRGKTLVEFLHLKQLVQFPTFNLLKELECICIRDIKDVLELVQVLPPLESLIIQVTGLDEYEFGGTLTPKTLSKLEKVALLNYSGTQGQHDLAKYFLEKANKLKKLTITMKDVSNLSDDMLETVFDSLTKLKPESARFKFVVEEAEVIPGTWFGKTPLLLLHEGSRIVYRGRCWK